MAKSIFHIHNDVRELLNANLRAEDPETIDSAINFAVFALLNELIGNKPEEYGPGRPVPVKGGRNLNAVNQQAVMSLLQSFTFDSNPVSGEYQLSPSGQCAFSLLPVKIIHLDTVINYPTNSTTTPVEYINANELAKRLSSLLKPINTKYPVYELFNDGIQVYPSSITRTQIRTVIEPSPCFYSYTVATNGALVYSDANSMDIPFGPEYRTRLTYLTARYLSIPVDGNTVLSVTQNQT